MKQLDYVTKQPFAVCLYLVRLFHFYRSIWNDEEIRTDDTGQRDRDVKVIVIKQLGSWLGFDPKFFVFHPMSRERKKIGIYKDKRAFIPTIEHAYKLFGSQHY